MGRTMTAVRAEALTASASRGEASVASPAPARGATQGLLSVMPMVTGQTGDERLAPIGKLERVPING